MCRDPERWGCVLWVSTDFKTPRESGGNPCRLSFIDDELPVSVPIALPAKLAEREVQVVGTVQYEMSLFGPRSAIIASLVLSFAEPARVSIYADESNEGRKHSRRAYEGEER